jgi:PleD family two-component response regulator
MASNPTSAQPKQALLVVGNIFFSSRLRDTLKHLGIGAVSARSDSEIDASISAQLPSVVIVDLTITTVDSARLLSRLKSAEATRAVPIVAFAGHLEADRLDGAAKAGVEVVVTNGEISANLPGIVASLGLTGAPA